MFQRELLEIDQLQMETEAYMEEQDKDKDDSGDDNLQRQIRETSQ